MSGCRTETGRQCVFPFVYGEMLFVNSLVDTSQLSDGCFSSKEGRWECHTKYIGQNWFPYFLSMQQAQRGQLIVVAVYACHEATNSQLIIFGSRLSQ